MKRRPVRCSARLAAAAAICLVIVTLTTLPPSPPLRYTPLHVPSQPGDTIPLHYWHLRNRQPHVYREDACATFPHLHEIHYFRGFSQRVQLQVGAISVYAAYWDGREEPMVRVLAHSKYKFPQIYCQLWYLNEGSPRIVPASAVVAARSRALDVPAVFTCPLTAAQRRTAELVQAVSLVTAWCQNATNVFRLQNVRPVDAGAGALIEPSLSERSAESAVAVCLVLPPGGEDISLRLVEWLELVLLLGGHKVYVYYEKVHKNTREVLDYYWERGVVEPSYLQGVLPARAAASPPQRLPFSQCLYSALQTSSWLLVLDLDQMLVPSGDGLASPPVDVELIDIGTDWVTLRWHEPTWTGGRPILFYVVKYRHTSKFSDQFLKDPTPRSDNRWVIEKRTSSDVHKAKVIYLDPGVLYEFQVLACTLAGVGRGANLFVPLPPEDEVMTQAKAEIYTSTLKKHGHFKKHKTDKTFNLLKFPLSLWTDQG